MKCSKCGEEVRAGLKRCEDCGTPVPQPPQQQEAPRVEATSVTNPEPAVKPVSQTRPAESVRKAATSTAAYSQEVVVKGISRWHTLFLLIFGIGCLAGSLFVEGGIHLFNNPEKVAIKVVAAYSSSDAAGMVSLFGDKQECFDTVCSEAEQIENKPNLGTAVGEFVGGLFGAKPKPKVVCDKTQAIKSMQTVMDKHKGHTYQYVTGKESPDGNTFMFTMRVSAEGKSQDINKMLVKTDGSWLYAYNR